jgi:hypothetical protein
MQEIEPTEISRYKKYLESMKRANKKYRENNKDKLREIARNYYNNHKDEEEFKIANREKAKKSYQKKRVKDLENTTLLILHT